MSHCNISWDSFEKNISDGFSQFQQEQEFVDMTLAADGYLVKVHRNLMALSSSYLREMLHSAPCQHPVVFLSDIDHDTLAYLVEYIYTGEVNVPVAKINLVLKAAKALHIKGLQCALSPSEQETLPCKNNAKQNFEKLINKQNEDENENKKNLSNVHTCGKINVISSEKININMSKNNMTSEKEKKLINNIDNTKINISKEKEKNIFINKPTSSRISSRKTNIKNQKNENAKKEKTLGNFLLSTNTKDKHINEVKNTDSTKSNGPKTFNENLLHINIANNADITNNDGKSVNENIINISVVNNSDNTMNNDVEIFNDNTLDINVINSSDSTIKSGKIIRQNVVATKQGNNCAEFLRSFNIENNQVNILNSSENMIDNEQISRVDENLINSKQTHQSMPDISQSDQNVPSQLQNTYSQNINTTTFDDSVPVFDIQFDANQLNYTITPLISGEVLQENNDQNMEIDFEHANVNQEMTDTVFTNDIEQENSESVTTLQPSNNVYSNDTTAILVNNRNKNKKAFVSKSTKKLCLSDTLTVNKRNTRQKDTVLQLPTHVPSGDITSTDNKDENLPAICVDVLEADASTSNVHIKLGASVETKEIGKKIPDMSGTSPLFVLSSKGCLKLILNRYMYYCHYDAFAGRKRRWRCIDYRRLKCKAFMDTEGDIIVTRKFVHCHSFHDDKIFKSGQSSLVFTSMTELVKEAARKNNEELSQIEVL